MTPKDFLNFIRWKNVVIIALVMLLTKFVLFEKFELNVALDSIHYALLTISTICVAIAGYIINDIHDIKADRINKPDRIYVGKKISRVSAYNLFIAFNAAGLLLGMYLSYHVRHTSYFILYVITSLLLYQYARQLKKKFLVGNLIVSFAVFLSIILPAVFDLLPVTSKLNEQVQMTAFRLVALFALFGFFLTLVREIVKDMEDLKGDLEMDVRSLPVVLGTSKTKAIVVGITLLLFLAVLFFAYMLMDFDLYASVYLGAFVAIPLLYFVYVLWKASDKEELHKSSSILKVVMLLGILTILLI